MYTSQEAKRFYTLCFSNSFLFNVIICHFNRVDTLEMVQSGYSRTWGIVMKRCSLSMHSEIFLTLEIDLTCGFADFTCVIIWWSPSIPSEISPKKFMDIHGLDACHNTVESEYTQWDFPEEVHGYSRNWHMSCYSESGYTVKFRSVKKHLYRHGS